MIRRREFLALPAAAAAVTAPKRIAALTTTYHVRSHADNVITRFLEGYWIQDKFHKPSSKVAALYMDQLHPGDIGQKLAGAYGFPVCKSIEQALGLGGAGLAADGVLLVAEHGNYPHNEKNQQLYPRYEFFKKVVKTFRAAGRSVPVFVDKHLSYDWTKAKAMYDWSRELGFPLMAGSSVSVTFRRPVLDYPLGVEFESALMVGGGWVADGGIFHNLETLQCFVERRKGGETGIRAVELLKGDAVWRAGVEGRWSRELLNAALERRERPVPGQPESEKDPVLCLLEYRDGFRAAVLMLGSLVSEYLVGFRTKGSAKPDSTLCYLPIENSNNFSPLVHAVEEMFQTGKLLYPVERTLLTTGALAALMESGFRGKPVETPELAISYRAPENSYFAHGAGS